MEQKIEVCIGTDRAGGVRVRLSLLILNGESVVQEKFHSAMLMPGDDAAAVRREIEGHLAMRQEHNGITGAPWPAIPDAEWAKVTQVLPAFHTPEAIAQHRARVAEAERQRDDEEARRLRRAAEQDEELRRRIAAATAVEQAAAEKAAAEKAQESK